MAAVSAEPTGRDGNDDMTERPGASPAQAEAPFQTDEVRRRATRGAALLTARGLAVRGLSAGGAVVLARLLTPADFGAVAIGSAIVVFVSLVSDGGLGMALVRGDHKPSRLVFEQLLGLQLAIAVGVTLLVLAAAPVSGRPGWIAAVMTASFCIAVFQTPGTIHFERDLMFRQLAAIEVAENVAYVAWAIATVLLGAGVWGLATASVVGTLVATGLTLRMAPGQIVRPRLGLTAIRPLIAFGARFQAISVVNLIRDQGLNIGITAVAGLGTLGVWTMAYRFIQVPFLIFETLWRVTFPAMARLIEAGEDPRAAVQNILMRSAVVTGAVLSALVGATPALIPAIFERQWHQIVNILPWACAGLLVGGPVSVAVAGFLLARGDAATALRGALLHTAASLILALTLLPVIGVTALGLSVLASSAVEGAVLGTRAAKAYQVRIVRPLVIPTLAGLVAATIGWITAEHVAPLALGAVAGAGVALGVFLGALRTLSPQALWGTVDMVNRSIRSATG